MDRGAKIVLAFMASAIVALVIALVLGGLAASGVISMQITHVLFWLAFGISAVAVTLWTWSNSWSIKPSILTLGITLVVIGGGLLWLDKWLQRERARQEARTQPPSMTTSGPKVPMSKTDWSQYRAPLPSTKLTAGANSNVISGNNNVAATGGAVIQQGNGNVAIPGNTGTVNVPGPLGQIGVAMAPGAFLHMQDSQVIGYQTGIDAGVQATADVNHSQVSNQPLPMPTPSPFRYRNPAQATSSISNVIIKGKQYDLPLNPIPFGKSASALAPEEQRAIISELAQQWKKGNPGLAAKKQAIIWINQQLEAQAKDFRVEVPMHCPPQMNSTAIYVGPDGGTVDGVETKGFDQGVIVSNGKGLQMDGTAIVADNCD
jgi:hypothetical protein